MVAFHFWKQVCIHASANERTQMAGEAAKDRIIFIVCRPDANSYYSYCWCSFIRNFFRKRCGDAVWKTQDGRQQAICQGDLCNLYLAVIWSDNLYNAIVIILHIDLWSVWSNVSVCTPWVWLILRRYSEKTGKQLMKETKSCEISLYLSINNARFTRVCLIETILVASIWFITRLCKFQIFVYVLNVAVVMVTVVLLTTS